ncbi:hypothetical protein Anapl_07115 [Anas platyrhynchos]|uniref:Uncharacterized protein n=1 Tax=Anas platyrhynchos TaxID=8839 RepID=R0LFY1_ANAPL|nr:hypothetical protein Anapl_07115 [Anas platyrhynchos]
MTSLRHELTTIFLSSILQELVTRKLEAHVTVPTGSQHVTICSQQWDCRQDGCISRATCQQCVGDGSDPKEGQARNRLQGDPLLGRGQQPLLEGLLLLYVLPHSVAYMEGKPGDPQQQQGSHWMHSVGAGGARAAGLWLSEAGSQHNAL